MKSNTRTVFVDGKKTERKIVEYRSLAEHFGCPFSLRSDDCMSRTFIAIPETFPGEKIHLCINGDMLIVKDYE